MTGIYRKKPVNRRIPHEYRLFVYRVIISWRTEVRDVRPSDRTELLLIPFSLDIQALFGFLDSICPTH